MSGIGVKICGLSRRAHLDAAARAGATYAGFVLFEKSPRHVSVKRMRDLALSTPAGLARVALTVDADDATLDALFESVPLEMLQLHGGESPGRVTEVRARYGLPVMKAVGIADEDDLPVLDDYEMAADRIRVDAKPPGGAALPGGNGLSFDWRLLERRKSWRCPWMLAGGLTPENVAEAIRLTGARQVDASSGVERAPGVKDTGLIAAFCTAAVGNANREHRAQRKDRRHVR